MEEWAMMSVIFCDLIFFTLCSCLSCTHVAPLDAWKWKTSTNNANLIIITLPIESMRQTMMFYCVNSHFNDCFKLLILLNNVCNLQFSLYYNNQKTFNQPPPVARNDIERVENWKCTFFILSHHTYQKSAKWSFTRSIIIDMRLRETAN